MKINRNCIGLFLGIPWNQTSDVHRGSTLITYEPWHEISNNVTFCHSVDSDEPVQPPFKLRNSK